MSFPEINDIKITTLSCYCNIYLHVLYTKLNNSYGRLPSPLGLWKTPTASLQRGKTMPQMYPGYGTKQSDGDVSVMLELWGMQSTPASSSLQGPLWHGVVASDRVLFIVQLELNCVFMLN